MKKTKKFFVVVLTCLCVLGIPMTAFAGAPTTLTCPSCGGTASFSGSYVRSQTVTSHDHVLPNKTVPCTITTTGYEDMYRCTCNNLFSISRWEENHEYRTN